MSYHKSRRGQLKRRGRTAMGAIAVVGGGAPRCPVCGSCGYDARRAQGAVELLHCPVCGRWSAAGMWGPCEQVIDVVDSGYAYPWGWGRPGGGGHHGGGHHGGGHHGGGGHHPHHGLGDVGDPAVDITPPTVASGSAAEQTALLQRVANAQEAFNRQDLMMRKWQIASVVAIPVAAQVWAWLWALIKRRRGASSSQG